MKKFINIIFFCLSLLIMCIGNGVRSEEQSNSFSISPLNPDTNQPQSSYYNLKVKPSEKKTIKIRIFNSKNKDIEVNVEANDATTNDNGVISYSNEGKTDKSLKIPFSTITSFKEKKVKVPKQGSTDVEILINIPKEEYKGIILGGIRVSGVSREEEVSKDAPAVKANIAYSVAVLLSEKDEVIDPSMHLLGVEKENKNYRNYISAKLQNSAPRLIKKLEAHAKIFKKGSTELLYEAKKEEMQMAPNSHFNFGVSLEDTPIQSGNYTMKISGKADGVPFSFEEDFEVTKEEAKTLNKNAVYVTEQPDHTLLYILIVIFIGLGLILIYLAYKKMKQRKERNMNESK